MTGRLTVRTGDCQRPVLTIVGTRLQHLRTTRGVCGRQQIDAVGGIGVRPLPTDRIDELSRITL